MFRFLDRKFGRMGARIKLDPGVRGQGLPFSVDILQDRKGEYFSIAGAGDASIEIDAIDVRPKERHLLLLVREGVGKRAVKHKFLCGHDERHWFVAAVPDGRGVKDVPSAMEALKPDVVRTQQTRKKARFKGRKRRKNEAFVRQGEWFFLPRPDLGLRPDDVRVRRREPLRRGGGKPHMCEYLYRTGGQRVYVSTGYPNGVTEEEYRRILSRDPRKARWGWNVMVRDPKVFVRGRVWHPDHATIVLDPWHRVVMNTETEAPSMRNVAFLD